MAWEELGRGYGTSSSSLQPDGHLRSGDSCRMKTAVGLGLVKGSANQPLSQTTIGLLWHRAWWDSGQGHSLPPPVAFGCSLSPHALRVPQVRPPGGPADETAT